MKYNYLLIVTKPKDLYIFQYILFNMVSQSLIDLIKKYESVVSEPSLQYLAGHLYLIVSTLDGRWFLFR